MRLMGLGLALGLIALGLTATEASARARFEGTLVVTAATGTCVDYNPVGEEMVVRFRPAGVDGNPADTGFTYLWSNGGYNATVPGSITATYKQAVITSLFDYVTTEAPSGIRFTAQSPAVIDANTQSVNVIGNLENFDTMPGCTATFRMTAVKRLN